MRKGIILGDIPPSDVGGMREYALAPALKQGKKVYEDGSYTVYVFDSTEDLMDCAVARK